MRRRDFLRMALGGIFAGGMVSFLSGCSGKIDKNVYKKDKGSPWRCTSCGYITRSNKDLSNTRCPRCYSKALKKITEDELKQYLAEEKN